MSDPLHYIDSSAPYFYECRAVSNPADKRQLYPEVMGMTEAQPIEEKPKVPRPLPLSVRRCCAHPGDEDYDGLVDLSDAW